MKQPELGQKILELRQRKGLTQEELVDRCNLSVRTIQRIEAGEVTPRMYTVKAILTELDYDLQQLRQDEPKTAQEFKKLFLLDVDDEKEAGFLNQQLTIAWICGLIYFVVGFVEFAADWSRFFEDEMLFGRNAYIVVKLVVMVSYVLFMRGMVLTGKIFKNYLLKIVAFIMIFMSILFYGYDIVSIFTDFVEIEFVLAAESITFGIIGIFLGIALFRLQNGLGTLAPVAAVLELIAAIFFLTVFLGWLGMIFLTPAILIEVLLLYKVTQLIKEKQRELA